MEKTELKGGRKSMKIKLENEVLEHFQEEKRVSLYTDKEWEQVKLGYALINGYKANKGRAGYVGDYNRGKDILDAVRAGKFR
jgi:hypothetical protein